MSKEGQGVAEERFEAVMEVGVIEGHMEASEVVIKERIF